MSFKLGVAGLCTSHPECWIPVIRELSAQNHWDIEVAAVWDSQETRPAGYAPEFARRFEIPRVAATLDEMAEQVDGVIVHTANWDRHLEEAAPFVAAGKSVFLDKPVAGNLKDINQVLQWRADGVRLIGGSALHFCHEAEVLRQIPESERGRFQTVYAAMGVDEFNYGIHLYAMVQSLLGPGVVSVRCIGESNQAHFYLRRNDGVAVMATLGKTVWLPSTMTVITDRGIRQIQVDNLRTYRDLLEHVLPYLCGRSDVFPLREQVWLEPEKVALAARVARNAPGQEIFLRDLELSDPGYDGTQFAREYRAQREAAK